MIALRVLWVAGCLLLMGGCAKPAAITPRAAGGSPMMVFGLCEDYPEESRTIEKATRDLDLLKHLGVRHLRVGMGWDGIEPEPGKYDWAFWDAFFKLAADRDIVLLPYVCYTPKWAAKDAENFTRQPPKDVAAFGRFMTTLAKRYKGKAHTWEIWNEPDNPDFWLGSREEFAELVKAGSAAVRQVDRDARVVLGGIAWETDFIAEMLADYDLGEHVDVINVHAYFETWSPDPIEQIPALVNRVSDIIAQHGNRQKIWLAEVGYSSYRDGARVSDAYQARYAYEHTPDYQADALLRTMTLALSTERVELLAWYRIHDLPAKQEVIGDVNNRHLGILSVDGREKPVAVAIRRAVEMMGSVTRSVGRETRLTRTMQGDLQAHAFQRTDGSLLLVTWLQTSVPGATATTGPDSRREVTTVDLPGHYWVARHFTGPREEKTGLSVGRYNQRTTVTLTTAAGETRLLELRPADRP